jgi:hypothetical protein
VIPNLTKEVKKVPISSIVLSGQRVDLKDSLYNAVKGKEEVKDTAANPLVEDNKKLIPSVTRVFSQGKQIYVYLQAYQESATVTTPVVASVTLYQAQTKVFETKPVAVTPSALSRLGTVPLNFTLGLNQIPPGKYDCQVTVIDPTGRKATFWQAPIMIVP